MTTEEIRALLKEAREAYHRLLTGALTATVRDQNGEQISYSRIDIGELKRYIEKLEDLLDPSRCRSSRPMTVYM